MAKISREKWTVTLAAEPGDAAPIEVRIRHFLKRALRVYRLKNWGAAEIEGRWRITLAAVGNDLTATASMRLGQLLETGTACFGLKVVDVHGYGPDGQPMQPEALAGQREALLGPVLMDGDCDG